MQGSEFTVSCMSTEAGEVLSTVERERRADEYDQLGDLSTVSFNFSIRILRSSPCMKGAV